MDKKQQAIELRRQGFSYREIQAQIRVSAASLSEWVRNLALTDEQKARLRSKQASGTLQGAQAVKKLWQARRQQVAASYRPPLEDPRFLFGLALYWGEGKKYTTEVVLGNTSPALLRCFIAWIKRYFAGEYERFSVSVQHHRGLAGDAMVLRYWAQELGIPLAAFTRSILVRPRGVDAKDELGPGYGVASVRVCGASVWVIREKIDLALTAFVPRMV